ncbi:CpaD family pilus assembly lipoprotein [Castellaniella sp.]|uniref:CpaD family pilus assembly lipoprotein n=1 Tax=Castellaniella sp. TaxID=1955812 RepID=UPI002AFEDA60|nr:CpaD family pilus assembly lipoprotein [Castellaniella sp.]
MVFIIPSLRVLVVAGAVLALSACAFPDRDYHLVPDADVIKVQLENGQWVAIPPQCASLHQDALRGPFDNRAKLAFGCATYTNLANSVARPRDLVAPNPYAGHQPDAAASAVTRYRENKTTPIQKSNTTSMSGS